MRKIASDWWDTKFGSLQLHAEFCRLLGYPQGGAGQPEVVLRDDWDADSDASGERSPYDHVGRINYGSHSNQVENALIEVIDLNHGRKRKKRL